MSEHIWTEKYRPKTFVDIKGQDEIVKTVQSFVEAKNLPHLLFIGPAGVGKTSLAVVIARELYGEDYKANTLELNASDERGIDVVRNTIKDFARTRSVSNAAFKIIYLDEADALTKEAQQALRRTMENYTSSCRFILSCNYASKIIDPIQSRCAVFKFKPLSQEHIEGILESIATNEGLTISAEAKKALFLVSKGDVRRLENILQAVATTNKEITEKAVYEMASVAKPEELREVLLLAQKGSFVQARDLLLKTMLNYGMSGLDVVKQIQGLVWELDMESHKQLALTRACGECEFRIIEGSDDFVQLEALLAQFILS
ncbi:MAG: replication factor C small subunit [Candidatus Woesearchaeota archaeon]